MARRARLGLCASLVAIGLSVVAAAAQRSTRQPARHAATHSTRKASQRERRPRFPADAGESRACAAARLEPAECFAELEKRDVRFHKSGPAPGVRMPVRLDGPVGGVWYRTDYPDSQRTTVPFEVFDCRLVVALAELAPILRAHDVDEVRIFSAWRPPAKGWPAGKVTDRHPGGLAADLRLFKKSGGDALEVLADFHGRIGAEPCGPAAVPPSPDTPRGRELRSILCAAADARLFHVLLSPNFDRHHANHFHVEVRPDVRWFIVR